MKIKIIFYCAFIFFSFCKSEKNNFPISKNIEKELKTNLSGNTIKTRFNPPNNFSRIKIKENSFANYLRELPLKKDGEKVYLFNGNKKINQNIHAAVIEMDTGKRDLQQCADAVMRLRAEYFFSINKFENIHFNFTNGFNAEYKKWRNGNRISVKNNKVKWIITNSESESYNSFRKYLNMVFAYAGTSSLEKEMKKKETKNMQIGDVFIQGGFPGHAVIVVDICENKTTGDKLFMLAQSYMPAQDMHILKNLNNEKISPWYELNFGEKLITPEWEFHKNNLMTN